MTIVLEDGVDECITLSVLAVSMDVGIVILLLPWVVGDVISRVVVGEKALVVLEVLEIADVDLVVRSVLLRAVVNGLVDIRSVKVDVLAERIVDGGLVVEMVLDVVADVITADVVVFAGNILTTPTKLNRNPKNTSYYELTTCNVVHVHIWKKKLVYIVTITNSANIEKSCQYSRNPASTTRPISIMSFFYLLQEMTWSIVSEFQLMTGSKRNNSLNNNIIVLIDNQIANGFM